MSLLHLLKPEQNNRKRLTFLSHLGFQIPSVQQRLSAINQRQTFTCHSLGTAPDCPTSAAAWLSWARNGHRSKDDHGVPP